MNNQYILITPCKNESNNLPNLIGSISSQTIKPVVWVIIDDGSTDNTPEIIRKNEENYGWIKGLRAESNVRDLGLHLSKIMKKGFEYAIEYCSENNISYRYLGNVDGDIILEKTFFENLISEFKKDPELGIASGGTKQIIGNRIVYAKGGEHEPSGGHMLIRKECFEDCGGFPVSYACDSVLKAKARIKGWKTRRFEEYLATEIRGAHSVGGYWKGFFHRGECSYFLNMNPLHVLTRGIIYTFKNPYYLGFAFVSGYFISLTKRKPKSCDKEVKDYFWSKWKQYF